MITDLHEALFYDRLDHKKVQCRLCPKNCVIEPGQVGFCGVRQNESGKLYTLVYGKTTGISLDPIEKKPLYQYHPGELILSMGTRGCNFRCMFCQNWHISQNPDVYTEDVSAKQVIREVERLKTFGIAYTYNEPFIWYEFVYDCARLARKKGLKNVLITNGYVNQDPLRELLPSIGAMNIDLKGIDEEFYRKICQGSLQPVLDTIVTAKESCHIEITNLVIPTLNDTNEHFVRIRDWIFDNTGAETPLHFSRYFPCYELTIPATPKETLERARDIAGKKLKNVYLGNVG